MHDKSFNNWSSMTDNTIIEHIGGFVRHHRLQQNRSQTDVSTDAGLSRSTLSLLERGGDVRLSTLIQVLRELDLLYILDQFEVVEQISPMEIAKAQHSKRYRASSSSSQEINEPQSDW